MMDRQWLARRSESAVEPELEIVDAHHHLWDYQSRYGVYDLDDLRLDTEAGHNVVETVFVDCGANYAENGPESLRPVGETRFVAARAAASDATPGARIGAIVGHADLTLGDAVGEVLDHHLAEADGRFRGIRHSGARSDDPAVPSSRTEPPADLYARPEFRAGARALAERGLSFDAWQYHHQLGGVVALARDLPELTVVVNHLGGPLGIGSFSARSTSVRRELRGHLNQLAALDNVALKLGGVGMTRFGVSWHHNEMPPDSDDVATEWGDLIRFAIDTFGPDRCLFESNYPVDGETVGYVELWNAFKKITADYGPAERADLFAGTARRVYRL
ncbi:MAG: amidohydrolase family protein [Actinomycetota bacterium]